MLLKGFWIIDESSKLFNNHVCFRPLRSIIYASMDKALQRMLLDSFLIKIPLASFSLWISRRKLWNWYLSTQDMEHNNAKGERINVSIITGILILASGAVKLGGVSTCDIHLCHA